MKIGIIEIGSNNTKTHIYDGDKEYALTYENNTTIEFKANYKEAGKISAGDLAKLYAVIEKALEYTDNLHVYGCSIFRYISAEELTEINNELSAKFGLEIEVVTQNNESLLTAYGCYDAIDYTGNVGIFIGGGGSTEVIIVNDGKVIEQKLFDFGVVDITHEFESLKEDIPTVSFEEVRDNVAQRISDFDNKCDVLVLAGGDHLYWYNNAGFELGQNTLYDAQNQGYMITIGQSDTYDKQAFEKSLDEIRANSDNPKWFDGSRAMKVTTNVVSHKIGAKYIIPTKINMEDGLKDKLIQVDK
jgi:hypothetical protein